MFNHAPPDYACPFCALVRGDFNELVAAEHVVERTADTLTFVSPRWWVNNPGHVLVIPTSHHENLFDLPAAAAEPIQEAARRAALAMKAGYRCDGISTRQHNEPAGNQDVWHYHLHVFPRFAGDRLYRSDFRTATLAEMSARADELRAVWPGR